MLTRTLWLASVLVLLAAGCSSSSEGGGRTPESGLDAGAAHAETATADADPRAREIAEGVLEAMGGRAAWERTRFVRWHFMGMRKHWWDRKTGDVRIETGQRVVLMNLETRAGRVFDDGVELTEPEVLRSALDAAYGWWINDSYWMFMPYKLLDPGVKLTYGGEGQLPDGRRADVLRLSFEDVGLTPSNRYEVLVGRDTGLVEAWNFGSAPDKPLVSLGTWEQWELHGEILLAGGRGRGLDWHVGVDAELPESVFRSPAPTDG